MLEPYSKTMRASFYSTGGRELEWQTSEDYRYHVETDMPAYWNEITNIILKHARDFTISSPYFGVERHQHKYKFAEKYSNRVRIQCCDKIWEVADFHTKGVYPPEHVWYYLCRDFYILFERNIELQLYQEENTIDNIDLK